MCLTRVFRRFRSQTSDSTPLLQEEKSSFSSFSVGDAKTGEIERDELAGYLNDDVWMIVFSYFAELSDFERIALLSRHLIFKYFKEDSQLTDTLVKTAQDHLKISQITDLMSAINSKVTTEYKSLLSLEEKKPIKKAQFARGAWTVFSMIPATVLITLGLEKYEIVAQLKSLKAIAGEIACTSCKSSWDQSLVRCGSMPGWIPQACSGWNSEMTDGNSEGCNSVGGMYYSCSKSLCNTYYAFCNQIDKNFSDGTGMIAGGVVFSLGFLLGHCFNIESLAENYLFRKVVKRYFSELFDEDIQAKASQVLKMGMSDVSRLTIITILTKLRAALETVSASNLRDNIQKLNAGLFPPVAEIKIPVAQDEEDENIDESQFSIVR